MGNCCGEQYVQSPDSRNITVAGETNPAAAQHGLNEGASARQVQAFNDDTTSVATVAASQQPHHHHNHVDGRIGGNSNDDALFSHAASVLVSPPTLSIAADNATHGVTTASSDLHDHRNGATSTSTAGAARTDTIVINSSNNHHDDDSAVVSPSASSSAANINSGRNPHCNNHPTPCSTQEPQHQQQQKSADSSGRALSPHPSSVTSPADRSNTSSSMNGSTSTASAGVLSFSDHNALFGGTRMPQMPRALTTVESFSSFSSAHQQHLQQQQQQLHLRHPRGGAGGGGREDFSSSDVSKSNLILVSDIGTRIAMRLDGTLAAVDSISSKAFQGLHSLPHDDQDQQQHDALAGMSNPSVVEDGQSNRSSSKSYSSSLDSAGALTPSTQRNVDNRCHRQQQQQQTAQSESTSTLSAAAAAAATPAVDRDALCSAAQGPKDCITRKKTKTTKSRRQPIFPCGSCNTVTSFDLDVDKPPDFLNEHSVVDANDDNDEEEDEEEEEEEEEKTEQSADDDDETREEAMLRADAMLRLQQRIEKAEAAAAVALPSACGHERPYFVSASSVPSSGASTPISKDHAIVSTSSVTANIIHSPLSLLQLHRRDHQATAMYLRRRKKGGPSRGAGDSNNNNHGRDHDDDDDARASSSRCSASLSDELFSICSGSGGDDTDEDDDNEDSGQDGGYRCPRSPLDAVAAEPRVVSRGPSSVVSASVSLSGWMPPKRIVASQSQEITRKL